MHRFRWRRLKKPVFGEKIQKPIYIKVRFMFHDKTHREKTWSLDAEVETLMLVFYVEEDLFLEHGEAAQPVEKMLNWNRVKQHILGELLNYNCGLSWGLDCKNGKINALRRPLNDDPQLEDALQATSFPTNLTSKMVFLRKSWNCTILLWVLCLFK